MRCKSLTTLVLLLGAFPVAGQQVKLGKPEAEAELLTRPVVLPSSPLSVDSAFQLAMLGSGVPGGEALIQECAEPSESAVRPQQRSTLRELLENIVKADPEYRWEVKDGVVNLMPIKGVPDLLTLRIDEFDSGDATDVTTAKTFLFALPEVRKRVAELGFNEGGIGTGLYGVPPPGTPPPPKLDVRLHDVTLLEALNALVRARNRGLWIYRETYCEATKHFDIKFTE